MPNPLKTETAKITTTMALVALAACAWLLLGHGVNPPQGVPVQAEYKYPAGISEKIPEKLLQYTQIKTIPTGFEYPQGIALLSDKRIIIVGDEGVRVIDKNGRLVANETLKEEPRAIAAYDGDIAIVLQNSILTGKASDIKNGKNIPIPPQWLVTSIAMNDKYILLADATNPRAVLYTREGLLIRDLAGPNGERPAPLVPSPYFDVAFSPEGYMLTTDPGRHHIQGFTLDDKLEFSWGKSGLAIADFSGCCNPTDIAPLIDGSVVTAEKGTPRIKVYDPGGTLSAIVAGGEIFDETTSGIDLAVDKNGIIYALDPTANLIRVFRRKETGNATSR